MRQQEQEELLPKKESCFVCPEKKGDFAFALHSPSEAVSADNRQESKKVTKNGYRKVEKGTHAK